MALSSSQQSSGGDGGVSGGSSQSVCSQLFPHFLQRIRHLLTAQLLQWFRAHGKNVRVMWCNHDDSIDFSGGLWEGEKNAPQKENLKQVRTEIERDTLSVKVCVFIHDRCESWRLQCAPTATTHSRVVYCSTDPSESRTETTEHPPHRCRRYITTVENTMQQAVLWKCEETILFAFKWFTRRQDPGTGFLLRALLKALWWCVYSGEIRMLSTSRRRQGDFIA